MTARVCTGHLVDVLAGEPAKHYQVAVMSPPYWLLRRYGTEPQVWGDGWRGELGSEPTPELFVAHLVDRPTFAHAVRTLRNPAAPAWPLLPPDATPYRARDAALAAAGLISTGGGWRWPPLRSCGGWR